MRNPTLHDVARAAGVSYSTADRVLNGRGGVAVKSVQRVRQAIEDLGYRRDITAANLSRRRSYRFAAFVPQGDHGFFSAIRRAFLAEAEIDEMLARLQTLSDDHFNAHPDEINWGHVGTLNHYSAKLREITDMAFREGEHAE